MTSVYPASAAAEPASLAERIRYVEWSSVIAGAIAAAALALVLHAFALAVGLSVSSTAPTWRDASFALAFLSGLYLILAALAAYGLGGYLAGLMHTRLTSREDADMRDGLHGLLVWGLATLLGALIALAAVQPLTRLVAPSGGQAGSSTSVSGERIIAFDLDRLFRAERRPNAELDYPRSEAARILLTASSHRGVQPDDRAYLVRLTAANAGIAPPDAERRVEGEHLPRPQERRHPRLHDGSGGIARRRGGLVRRLRRRTGARRRRPGARAHGLGTAGAAILNAPCDDEGGRVRDSRSDAAPRRDPLGPAHLQEPPDPSF